MSWHTSTSYDVWFPWIPNSNHLPSAPNTGNQRSVYSALHLVVLWGGISTSLSACLNLIHRIVKPIWR